jgi:hypothetical protein
MPIGNVSGVIDAHRGVAASPLQIWQPVRVRLELAPGETSIEKWRANHSRGCRAVGGTLWLTNRRVVFIPHGFERMLGQTEWACDLADVSAAQVADRKADPFSGGLRRRLLVRGRSCEEYFVINRVNKVAYAISAALATA